MVFQGKINVSPAVQFTVTVTRTLWKPDGICKYVNSDDSCIYNKQARAQNKALEFRRFLLELLSICCTMEIYNEGSDTRIFFIFILKTTSIGSHVGKKLKSTLIHTLTWLNFNIIIDYAFCWARLTQSRFSGVFHGWPGVKNGSATPNKISRT